MAGLLSAFLTIVAPPYAPPICPIIKPGPFPSCNDYLSRTYDFIIVGGGTAGCVLANRLTEIPNIQVLLLEDGDYPSRLTEIPLDFLFLQQTREDWAFKARQKGFFKGDVNQENNWPQGHALGGSSSINAMIYAPGVPFDYDLWAQLTNDPIWSWEVMQGYFDKLQENVRTTTYANDRLGRLWLELGARYLQIPVNDPNSIFGYKDHATTISEFTRFSMAKAYLRPISDRPNLCVVVNRHVNKIIIEGDTAIGVEVQDENGVVMIRAQREVLVTAGAINSPKLLMLSGIGPVDLLTKLGIPVYANLPVGQYLEDHLVVPIFATVLDPVPMPPYLALETLYCTTGQQLGNIELANFIGFFNTKHEEHRPDIEFIHFEFLMQDSIFLEGFFQKFGVLDEYAQQIRNVNQWSSLLLFLPTLLHPISRGVMYIQDTNPQTPPLIYPNYLAVEDDIQVLIASINQTILPMLNTPPFVASRLFRFSIPECDGFTYMSDDYWRCYFTYFVGTIYHAAGTCRMGASPLTSVVDSRLRVWGINNLRVVDSSTIPALVSGHNNIPTCALAEHGADIIKEDNNI